MPCVGRHWCKILASCIASCIGAIEVNRLRTNTLGWSCKHYQVFFYIKRIYQQYLNLASRLQIDWRTVLAYGLTQWLLNKLTLIRTYQDPTTKRHYLFKTKTKKKGRKRFANLRINAFSTCPGQGHAWVPSRTGIYIILGIHFAWTCSQPYILMAKVPCQCFIIESQPGPGQPRVKALALCE